VQEHQFKVTVVKNMTIKWLYNHINVKFWFRCIYHNVDIL